MSPEPFLGGLVLKYWGRRGRYFLFVLAILGFLGVGHSQELPSSADSRLATEEVPEATQDLALPPQRRTLIPITEQDTMSRKKSPFSYSYFNWATVNSRDYRNGDGQFSFYNFVGVDYRLNYESKISFRPVFFLSSAGRNFFGEDVGSEIAIGDPYFQYSHYDIALLPGDIGLFGAFRLYVPLSDASKVNKQLTRTEGRFVFTTPVGRGIELSYHFHPGYYFYARRGTTNHFGFAKGNKQAELEHFLELSERLTTELGFSQRVGLTHQWIYDVPSMDLASKRDEFLNLSFMASYSVSSVNFLGGVINDIKLREFKTPSSRLRQRPLVLLREEELQYSLMTYVRF